MKRRTFLAVAAAAAAAGAAGPPKRLKILIPPFPADQQSDLRATVPEVDLVVPTDLVAEISDADATYGFASPELVRAGKNLKWIQIGSAGVEGVVSIPELVERPIVLTNMQRVYGPEIADQAIGYLLAFTRGLGHFIRAQAGETWDHPKELVLDELLGKTLLVIGLGGIGTEIARRAHAFGMKVVATDPKVVQKPPFVEGLYKPEAFRSLLPSADVVASAVPLTPLTQRMIGDKEFATMKRGVIVINVSRGKVIDTAALVRALDSQHVAAAGLDVTDPEPLPKGHPLWKRNVIITPHSAGQSPGGVQRAHDVFKENLRRFAKGQPLLNVVDKKAGY
jgi:phosphoglycerate dehydrogenase-like enzyme